MIPLCFYFILEYPILFHNKETNNNQDILYKFDYCVIHLEECVIWNAMCNINITKKEKQ